MMCKLSGMVTEADHQGWKPDDLVPYVETVVSAFGTDRVMFGSDWPVSTLAGGLRAGILSAPSCVEQGPGRP